MSLLEFIRTRVSVALNRRLSRAAFEQRRLRRFRRFAAFVASHSSYYARIIQEHHIDPDNCFPEQFPVLTKPEVMDNFDDIVTAGDITRRGVEEFLHHSKDPRDLYRARYHVLHTSGTSGHVGYFVFDGKSWARGIAQVTALPPLGFLPRRRRIAFMGATDGHFAGVSMTGSVQFLPLSLAAKCAFFEINRPLASNVQGINAFQPDILVGYGTALALLAEKASEGALTIRPRIVLNSGEPISTSAREAVEKAFGPCLRNVYACSEHLFLGVREAGCRSMRLLEDDLILELRPDCTLVTNLFNTTLPLIRYQMSDVLSPLDSEEHAPYRCIAEVVGRSELLPKFVNRHGAVDFISPHTINELLIPNIRRFQMRITSESSFTLAVVLDPAAGETGRKEALAAAGARLREILGEKELENVSFAVTPVEDLSVDPKTGKFRLILDQTRPAPAPTASASRS